MGKDKASKKQETLLQRTQVAELSNDSSERIQSEKRYLLDLLNENLMAMITISSRCRMQGAKKETGKLLQFKEKAAKDL